MAREDTSYKAYKIGLMVICSEGIGKVVDVDMISTDYGTSNPLHSVLLNGRNHVYRTVNDLEPTVCTEDHRWDPAMKWCSDCTAEEMGEVV